MSRLKLVSYSIPPELGDQIAAQAHALGMSQSALVRMLLSSALTNLVIMPATALPQAETKAPAQAPAQAPAETKVQPQAKAKPEPRVKIRSRQIGRNYVTGKPYFDYCLQDVAALFGVEIDDGLTAGVENDDYKVDPDGLMWGGDMMLEALLLVAERKFDRKRARELEEELAEQIVVT